jgi:hypothetical protein
LSGTNVSQSYPYTSETEAERAAAVIAAVNRFEGLGEKIAAEASPIPELGPEEPGQPHRWWVFVCPADEDFSGRLHVAGYAGERRALYTVCDTCGNTYLR